MNSASPNLQTAPSEECASSPAKSGRLGNPKTRTGCITCKIRRVKCDEAKPSCKRCTSTGRQCDGYIQPGPRKPKSSPQPIAIRMRLKFIAPAASPTPATALTSHHGSGLTPKDLRSLSYFHSTTASILGPWISDSFWKYHLPQLATSSPATQHAIIALAAAHEEVSMLQNSRRSGTDSSALEVRQQDSFSMQHYMRGVSALARNAGEEGVALATCAVFVVLNFMWGDFGTAILHMHSGVAIAERLREEGRGKMTELEVLLIRIFRNMSLKGMWEDRDPMTCFEVDVLELGAFRDMEEARKSIRRVTIDGMRLIRVGVILQHRGEKRGQRWNDLQDQISIHETNISCWSWNFESLLSTIDNTSPEISEAIDELWIAHISTKLWLHVSLTPSQPEPKSVFEAYIERVEQIYLKWAARRAADRYVLLKAGMFPPICYIARNASNSTLRIRATQLLARGTPYILQPEKVSKQIDKNLFANDKDIVEIEVDPGVGDLNLVLKSGAESGTWEIVQGG